MKIVLPAFIKGLLGSLVGTDRKNEIIAFLESDLKAAYDALKAVPDALKTGNIALAESYIAAFLAHLPQPISDAIVAYVAKKFAGVAGAGVLAPVTVAA